MWRYNTNEGATVSVSGILEVGGFYSGRRVGWTSTLTTRLGGRFVGSLRFSYADVNLDEGDFETILTGLRVAYSFTPRIYLQSLIQYDNQSDSFSGNVRFGWLNTAGTGLFIVFNQVEQTTRPRRVLDRALVVKFTRQFQLVL